MCEIRKSDEDWKQILTEEQFQIARKGNTEKPFSGTYYTNKENGVYECVCCGKSLFSSEHKYDSGSGWPSYWRPVSNDCIRELVDNSHGMKRIEVRCRSCDAHLGHVFEDGPEPTGLRYCINSAVLMFRKKNLDK